MARRLSPELERSVSTPASTRPQVASRRCPPATTSITSGPGKRRSVERKSEEAVVVMTTGTTEPGSSEGPLARCAKRPATTVGLLNELSTHSPLGAGQRTGTDARIASQRPWHGGMRTIDCLGESRVRENRTHGLGRGDWGGRTPGRDGTRTRRETDGTEPFRRTGYTEPAPYFTTPNRRLPGPLVQCSHGGGRLVPPGVHAEIGGSVDR